ncbi:hypothetical protein AVEN_150273-1 [Araneus ventricosus]|uniref:Uncharacterized protein n=1 Tax=Araneus ventricosus TaxID=182803 RepID=A0A4Y2HCW9_ARAVE|nr:hypothetical protein AVEN_150273-1 [Araneus ventricosus]
MGKDKILRDSAIIEHNWHLREFENQGVTRCSIALRHQCLGWNRGRLFAGSILATNTAQGMNLSDIFGRGIPRVTCATDCPVTKHFHFMKPSVENLSTRCENIVQDKVSLPRLINIIKILHERRHDIIID